MISVNELINEAFENFETQRYTDAAKIFRKVSAEAAKQDFAIDAIYFIYRGIMAWEKTNNGMEQVKDMLQLVYYTLNLAQNRSSKLLEQSTNLEQKVAATEVLVKIMDMLNRSEERDKLVETLVSHFVSAARKVRGQQRTDYLEKAYDNAKYSRDAQVKIGKTLYNEYMKLGKAELEKDLGLDKVVAITDEEKEKKEHIAKSFDVKVSAAIHFVRAYRSAIRCDLGFDPQYVELVKQELAEGTIKRYGTELILKKKNVSNYNKGKDIPA